MAWGHLGLPTPTKVQYQIAEYLQHGPKRCVIQAFRGCGKSYVSAGYVLWRLLLDPKLNFLVISASKSRSDDFSTFCLRLLSEMPLLEHLKPTEEQRCSKVAFDINGAPASQAPSVKSIGITGQITGSRADVIIADDVEVLNNSATEGMRHKLSETIKEFDAVIKPLETSKVIYLGTPQSYNSIYKMLPERGFKTCVWPSRFPTEKERIAYGDSFSTDLRDELHNDPTLLGKPTDPQRFSEADLMEREASYGRSGFALQFQLNTSLSDHNRYPLKLSDLIVMTLNPDMGPQKAVWASSPELTWHELPNVGLNGDRFYRPMSIVEPWVKYDGCCMSIDPSGKGRDETAYAVVKMLHGQLFLAEIGGLMEGYSPKSLEALAEVAKKHGVNAVIIEENFGGGMFTSLIKPVFARIHPCNIEEVRHSKQKEARIIDVLEPVMSSHKLIVDSDLVRKDYADCDVRGLDTALKYSLFYQMSRITRDRGALSNDDRLDALAMAVQYWVEQMGRDTDLALVEQKDRLLDDELAKFAEGVFGKKRKQQTWMSI
jgi:hypothetical protein